MSVLEEKKKAKSSNLEANAAYQAKLRKDPELRFLFFELTEQCNLNCKHCGSSCSKGKKNFLQTELVLRTLREVCKDFEGHLPMVCLTGGEPFLHPDFFVIVEEIVSLGFSWGITTNGTLITKETARRCKELKLQSITISLDGLEQTHNWLRDSPWAYQKAMEGIDNLNEVGIPIQITTVVHRKNIGELDDIYRLLCQKNTYSWRVINLEPIGRALDNKDLLLTRLEMLQLLDYIRSKRFDPDVTMDVCYGCSHYLSYDYENELRDFYFLCGAGIYVASIMVNGDIYGCLDIERRPELVQGNVSKDRFYDVWTNRFDFFRQERAELSPSCASCKERQYCHGDSLHTWDFNRNEPMFCILRKDSFYEFD